MNTFLRSVRVTNIYREFVMQGDNSFWSMVFEYLPDLETGRSEGKLKGHSRIDYREILSPEDFGIFVKLREWRKEMSNQNGIPVYTIFTNEQLAKVVKNRITTKAGLQEIDGVGEARINKYGEAVIRIVQQAIQLGLAQTPQKQTESIE